MIPASSTATLQAFARRHGATLFMTVMAAFQALLSRSAGQADVSVGTPIAGRNHVETESLIGFFANTLVLRTDLAGDPAFAELAARVREGLLGAYAHQDLPFERLVTELKVPRRPGRPPLFSVMFDFQDAPAATFEAGGLSLRPVPLPRTTSQFDLSVFIGGTGQGWVGSVEYCTDLFYGSTIRRLIRDYRSFLEAIAAVLEVPLGSSPWSPRSTRSASRRPPRRWRWTIETSGRRSWRPSGPRPWAPRSGASGRASSTPAETPPGRRS